MVWCGIFMKIYNKKFHSVNSLDADSTVNWGSANALKKIA